MRTVLMLMLAACLVNLQGCAVAGFAGAMIESNRRNSTKLVEAEYRGLEGKSWAVVVSADRSIQGEYSDVVPWVTGKITQRLVEQQDLIGGSGYVPPDKVLTFQYENPRWVTMPHSELAKALGVDRLIYVELVEYRLNEPGNAYLWSGLATGSVGVIEADGPVADEFVFSKPIRVAFPDKSGIGQQDMSQPMVATELGRRFVERASWLFYDHQEPYYPKY